MTVKIYHNPRCSKSRQALDLLREKNISPEVVLYLEKPLTTLEVTNLLAMLQISARDILRKKEDAFKELGLADNSFSEKQLINAICENPKLLERPIIINKDKAVIGRPVENILEII